MNTIAPVICQLGHVMNIDYTFCQVCNSRSNTDNNAGDIATQAANLTANPNSVVYTTTNLSLMDQ